MTKKVRNTHNDKVYMAIAHEVPEIGKRYSCYKIECDNSRFELVGQYTSIIQEIDYMGNNIYKVSTKNSAYIVNVVS